VSDSGLILCAYFAFPGAASPEGVVTAPLVASLARRLPCALVTAPPAWEHASGGAEAGSGGLTVAVVSAADAGGNLVRLTRWIEAPRTAWRGRLGRAVDFARHRLCGLAPAHMAAWSAAAAARLRAWQAGAFRGAPVWTRGMPPDSFAAVIRAWATGPFPLVVNYNDAMPRGLLHGQAASGATPAMDRLQRRQNAFFREHAQAYAFPSRRLAALMSQAAGFDSARCFVVPHLVPATVAGPQSAPAADGCVVYAGSAYPAVFTPALREGIELYARRRSGPRLSFILRNPDPGLRAWLAALPGVDVRVNLAPAETAARLSAARALLVADAPHHVPLLLTKVAEAVPLGKPVLAFTVPESTTAEVVGALGGLVVRPDSAQAVADGLEALARQAAAPTAASSPSARRVRQRFSEETIVRDVLAIADYAVRRFAWQKGGSAAQPEPPPPVVEAWP
jgi:hypothetical protein